MRIRALVSVTLPMTGPVIISTDQFLRLRLEPFASLLVINKNKEGECMASAKKEETLKYTLCKSLKKRTEGNRKRTEQKPRVFAHASPCIICFCRSLHQTFDKLIPVGSRIKKSRTDKLPETFLVRWASSKGVYIRLLLKQDTLLSRNWRGRCKASLHQTPTITRVGEATRISPKKTLYFTRMHSFLTSGVSRMPSLGSRFAANGRLYCTI